MGITTMFHVSHAGVVPGAAVAVLPPGTVINPLVGGSVVGSVVGGATGNSGSNGNSNTQAPPSSLPPLNIQPQQIGQASGEQKGF